jgi:antitoxin component YwqK of YwqJK toxin-antitoxin module
MRYAVLLAALLFSALHAFGDEILYRSNDFGMLLARIAPYQRDASRWVLVISRSGAGEQRQLYDNGKKARRWEISWNKEHSEKVEKEFSGTSLAARRVFDASGSLLQEEEYSAGVLTRKTLSTYSNGRLSRTRVLAGTEGKEVSSSVYLYAANGGLREVRRMVSPGETMVSSLVSGTAGVSEERSSMGGSLFIERYDPEGRISQRERRDQGVTASVEDFAYDAGSRTPASSIETLAAQNTVVDRLYDTGGRLSRESTSVKGAATETVEYVRDEKGTAVSKTRRGPEGLEAWKYSYSDAGDLSREEYYRKGSLVKVTVHGEGKLRTEELYRDGEMFLKAYYDGDTRLREEVYSDGALLRQRSYP